MGMTERNKPVKTIRRSLDLGMTWLRVPSMKRDHRPRARPGTTFVGHGLQREDMFPHPRPCQMRHAGGVQAYSFSANHNPPGSSSLAPLASHSRTTFSTISSGREPYCFCAIQSYSPATDDRNGAARQQLGDAAADVVGQSIAFETEAMTATRHDLPHPDRIDRQFVGHHPDPFAHRAVEVFVSEFFCHFQ